MINPSQQISGGPCNAPCEMQISGGLGECRSIMALPCVTSISASVPWGTSPSNTCLIFINEPSWSLSPAAGPGLTVVTNSAKTALTITVDDPDAVRLGTYTVKAVGQHNWGGGGPVTKTATFTITKSCAESCTSTPAAGATTAELGSVLTRVNLGRYGFGKAVGELSLHEKYPTNLLCTPACLGFLYAQGTNYQCEVVTNAAGVIQQVRVAEGLANIVTNNAYKYFIEIYSPSAVSTNRDASGCYYLSNSPLATITVENPDSGASTNKLRVTDGDGMVSDFEWKTNGWELVRGGGLRRERKTTVVTNSVRTTTVEVFGASGLEARTVRSYQEHPFGERLVGLVQGVDANLRSNYFEYYTNLASSTAGMLKQAVRADGSWEILQYDTNLNTTNLFLPFLNEGPSTNPSAIKVLEYVYGTNAAPGAGDSGKWNMVKPRLIIEKVQNREVSRTYKLYLPFEKREIRCVNPGALWNDSSNLVTTYKWFDSGERTNQLKSIEFPDGTMELRDYGFFTETNAVAVIHGTNLMYRTNFVYKGVPNGGKTAIVDGTLVITVLGRVGQKISRTFIDIVSGITNHTEIHSEYDAFNRPKKITYLDGTFLWTDHGCCGPTVETNREGTVITYYRDPLNRQAAIKRGGITTTNVMDASGRVLRTIRIGTDSSQITQFSRAYDELGNQTASTNALGQVTTHSEIITNYQRVLTTIYPDGGTKIETLYRDGRLASIKGTAVHPVRYEYGTEQEDGIWRLFTKEIKLDADGNDTSEWTKTYHDMLGRSYKTVFPDGATEQLFYDIKGQLVKQVDPDGVTTLFAYSASGEQTIVAQDENRDGVINTNGTDRIQQNLSEFATNGAANVRRALHASWFTLNAGASNLVSVHETSADGLRSWYSRFGLTNQSSTRYAGNGNRYVTNTTPNGSYTISYFTNGQIKSVTRKTSAGTQISQTTYSYDTHGRRAAIVDARNGTSLYTYDNADRLISMRTPFPGNGQGAQTISYTHDWAGRILTTTLADGTTVTNDYWLTGELKKTYGSRTYPVQHGYDAQGRRTNMITWKNFAADSGKAITTWKYDGQRGFMTNKVYDDGKGPSYAYTPAGRLHTRTWARGTVTTYHSNSLGETFATTYSDSTPAVTNHFDRQGRATNVIDGSGSRFVLYSSSGQVVAETNNVGELGGSNLRFAYDELQRRTNHSLFATNMSLLAHSYAFDGASRITNVSDGTYQAGYLYLANSALIHQVSYRSNSTMRMTTTKQYDLLNRLLSISSIGSTGASPVAVDTSTSVSFGYQYNDADQRTRVPLEDGSYWLYEYDKLGQVIAGKRYWSDHTPVAGQQYEYAFDDIGNRTSTKAGGDAWGGGLRAANYTANSLNQYTSRDVPAAADIIGAAHASATVTVNSQSPYRRGEYFWKELSINNASAAIWQAVTNIASLAGVNQTNTGNLFLPKTAETFTYDDDGNLTSNGRWTNKWDGENRLIEMTSHAGGPSDSRKSLQFAYDSHGRRYSKVVSNWTGSAWMRVLHEKFAYDGWNLVGVLDGTNNSILKSFLWGVDMSGRLRGAAGVGGLISVKQHSGISIGSGFAAYDGNGNVAAVLSADTGLTIGRYEYDPFGRTIRRTGTSLAEQNLIHFSSKPTDIETDLVFFGRRYLSIADGRWLNRDPVEESGGINLYAFLGNAPTSDYDYMGMAPGRGPCTLRADRFNVALPSGVWARTWWFLGDLTLPPQDCGAGCTKWIGINLPCDIRTDYSSGHSPGEMLSHTVPPKTLNSHEQEHATSFDNHTQDLFERALSFLGICMKQHCLEARLSDFRAYKNYLVADAEAEAAELDYADASPAYPTAPKRDEAVRLRALAAEAYLLWTIQRDVADAACRN